ncbi:MAG: cell division protein FtsB [Gammaproteobacteria bacterium]|nr:cell division protein FtsB [Gammaproteobacteria bacterium]
MRRGVVVLLLILLLLLQYRLWLGEGGVMRIIQLIEMTDTQLEENFDLLERNLSLEPEVKDLKYGLDSVEERARTELGMIKKDETFYQVVEGENGGE